MPGKLSEAPNLEKDKTLKIELISLYFHSTQTGPKKDQRKTFKNRPPLKASLEKLDSEGKFSLEEALDDSPSKAIHNFNLFRISLGVFKHLRI